LQFISICSVGYCAKKFATVFKIKQNSGAGGLSLKHKNDFSSKRGGYSKKDSVNN